MRILLDECVPRPFWKLLTGHEVLTVEKLGAKGLDNGALLARLRLREVGVLVTVDQNLPYQQNLQNAGIAVVVMKVSSNRLEDVAPLAGQVLLTLATIKPGQHVLVSI
jgi:hypothetical protein